MAARRLFAQLTAWGALALLAGAALKPPPCTPETCPAHSRPSGVAFTSPFPDCCPPAVEPLPDTALTQVQRLALPEALPAGPLFAAPGPLLADRTPFATPVPFPRGADPPLFVLHAAFLI